jgi:hypothetical protein
LHPGTGNPVRGVISCAFQLGSKKGFHLKAGFIFRSKHAHFGGKQSTEITIMKKRAEYPVSKMPRTPVHASHDRMWFSDAK